MSAVFSIIMSAIFGHFLIPSLGIADILNGHPPTNFLICGPSNSGKTTLAFEILKNKKLLFHPVPKNVILMYTHFQKAYEDIFALGVVTKLIEGFTNYEEIKELVMSYKYDGGSILIFDDMLGSLNDSILRIFHELSHHGSCSVFFLR